MFDKNSVKILIFKRIFLFFAIFTVTLAAPSFYFYENISYAQEPSEPNEYILEVLLLPTWRISEAIFAYELNGKYYLPLGELAEGFEFYTELEPETQYAIGFASVKENSFTIDGERNEVVIKGQKTALSEDAILVSEFLATDDIYVQLEVLNKIWPVQMNLELSTLTVFVETNQELSFMRDKKRKENQKIALSRREQRLKERVLLPRRDNDYQWLGKPVIDYQTNYRFDTEEDDLTGSNNFSGIQNIGKMQADFSTNFRFVDGNIDRPDNVRLRLSRRSAGQDNLWGIPGVRRVEAGDVALRQRELIANSSTGRGFTISNDNQDRGNEFDRITIEGVGPPGWEIELYNNEELIDFGEVPDDGLFFFEDVVLGFGNNEIKILFFGPQGQVREELRSYKAGGSMLKPGQFKYSAGLLDSDRSFILLDNAPRTTPRGVIKTLNSAFGVNQFLTIFGHYTEIPNADAQRSYVTIGSALSTPVGLFEVEAYNEIGEGHAVNIDYITSFFGFRTNLLASFFNDFESERSGFNNNRKKSEFEAQVTRNIKFFSVPIGLRFNAQRTARETGITTTNLNATQTFTRSGIRVSHSTRTRLVEDIHEQTTGILSSTIREGPWQFRGSLNYSLYPEEDLVSANSEIRYRSKNDFQTALSWSHNFETSDYRVGAQVGYDFKRFLGTFDSAYERGRGWDFTLRTTTSLHPYTDNGRYSFSSTSRRNSAPIRAKVFLDKDADGQQDEDEEVLEGVRLKYGSGRTKEKTNDEGIIVADLPYDKLTNIRLDAASIEDPYFIPATEGFSTVPIRGKVIEAVFPVIETGSIEGTAYRHSNKRAIPGLEIDLVNEETGEIFATVETGFDGFYVFEFVPPGTYSVKTSDVHQVDLLQNSATIETDDLYVYAHDVYINDANITIIEERFRDLEPSSGGLYDTLEKEVYGPPVAQSFVVLSYNSAAVGAVGLAALAAAPVSDSHVGYDADRVEGL